MNSNTKIIIGLVGQPVSGKDTVADHLASKYDFLHVSTGDLIRENITNRGLGEPKRELMQRVGNEMRSENGHDVLVKLALEKDAKRVVISGLRTTAETSRIKKEGGIILAILAPIEKRYKWATKRGRVGEDITFEDFKRIEKKDNKGTTPEEQNVKNVIAMADISLENDGGIEDLLDKADKLVENILAKKD